MVVDSLLIGDNGSVTSLRVIGEISGGKLYPANRVPRLSPDSSRAFDYLKRTPKGVSAAKVGESESQYAETLPDTITINGVERPTRNSNGQPIHPTIQGIENFWRWIDGTNERRLEQAIRQGENAAGVSGSAERNTAAAKYLFDGYGRPRVFFHGTTANIEAFDLDHKGRLDQGWLGRGVYLASDKDLAEYYANQKGGYDAGGMQNVMPMYVSLHNPLVANTDTKATFRKASKGAIDRWTAKMVEAGYDGVILEFAKGDIEVVAFNNAAVKSATGNNGEFSASNPKINRSFAAQTDGQKSTVSTSRDRLIEAFGKSLVTQLENIGLLNIAQTQLEAIDKAAADWVEKNGGEVDVVRRSLLSQVKRSVSADGVSVVMQSSEVGTDINNRHEFRVEVERIARARYAQKPPVPITVNSTNEVVFISWSSARHVLRDGTPSWQSALAVLHMEDLMRSAELVGTADDYKGRKDPSGAEFYRADAEIDGVQYSVNITVRIHSDGRRYYDHVVVEKKNPAGLPESERNKGSNDAAPTPPYAGSEQSISQPAIDVKRSGDGKIQGFYVPGLGKSYLIADNVSANDMPAVMVHEIGVHAATDSTDKRIAEKMQALNQRAADLLENETGEFFDRVNQRLADAGETSNEEKAAYLLEEARKAKDSAPASVRQWLKDVVAALKAWMFRNGMLGAGRLNQDDMLAVVEAYMRKVAGVRGNGDAKYSMIQVNVPDAIVANPLGDAASGPNHDKAKAGDSIAGMRLALKLVTPDLIEQLRGIENPIVLGVVSVEATGRNKIPDAAATLIAKALGAEKANGITQSSSPKRTQMDGLGRIFNRPEFSGVVEAGRNYIMVDDTITQGGTFASLAQHIEAGGGNVAAAIALTGKQYSRIITPSEQTLAKLREIHGDLENEFRQATGYGFDGLTESEARYLANFKPVKSVRDRVASLGTAARQQDMGSDAQGSGPVAPDDSVSQEVRFSRSSQSGAPATNQNPPKETNLQAAQRKIQDKLNRFTVIKEWLAKAVQFREWRESVGGKSEKMPEGSFLVSHCR